MSVFSDLLTRRVGSGGMYVSGLVQSRGTFSNGGTYSLDNGASYSQCNTAITIHVGWYDVKFGNLANMVRPENVDARVTRGGQVSMKGIYYQSGYALYSGGVLAGSGVSASAITVSAGSTLDVYYGGVVGNLNVKGGSASSGAAYVYYSGLVSGGTVGTMGELHVSSGGTASDCLVLSGGHAHVKNGGLIENTEVRLSGAMRVSSGGTASGAHVRGDLYVSGGAVNELVTDGGTIRVSSGGLLTNAHLEGGSCVVANGGSASNVVACDNNVLSVYSGGVVNGLVDSGGAVILANGAVVEFIPSVAYGKNANHSNDYVYSGNSVNAATIRSNCNLRVLDGGWLNACFVSSGCTLTVSSGGVASNVYCYPGGNVVSNDGASISMIDNVESDVSDSTTQFEIDPGTAVLGLSASEWGVAKVYGIVSAARITSGGSMQIYDGGIVYGNHVYDSNSFVQVYSGGLAISNYLYRGSMSVDDGGIAVWADVRSMSLLSVNPGGVARHVTVSSGGTLVVSSGAWAYDVVSSAGAVVTVAPGGSITYLEAGSVVSEYDGSTSYDETEGSLMYNNPVISDDDNGTIVVEGTAVDDGNGYVVVNGSLPETDISYDESQQMLTFNREVLYDDENGTITIDGAAVDDGQGEVNVR